MSSIEIRPFARDDREQVTAIVNAHVQAVVPGVSVSVNAVMSQLEREPGEYVVDPWVIERETLVAVRRDRVVAAAHLLRYAGEERVSESYRDAGEIRWLIFWPPEVEAADALAAASVAALERWGVERLYADGSLPVPDVYGVPACWPHVAAAYERAGFAHTGHTEVVFVAVVDELPRVAPPPIAGLEVHRELEAHATAFVATLAGRRVGYVELTSDITVGGTLSRLSGWADVWNLHVGEQYRRRGVATWLFGHAAEWLRLGRVERLLAECWETQDVSLAFLRSAGFREVTRTRRGWVRPRG